MPTETLPVQTGRAEERKWICFAYLVVELAAGESLFRRSETSSSSRKNIVPNGNRRSPDVLCSVNGIVPATPRFSRTIRETGSSPSPKAWYRKLLRFWGKRATSRFSRGFSVAFRERESAAHPVVLAAHGGQRNVGSIRGTGGEVERTETRDGPREGGCLRLQTGDVDAPVCVLESGVALGQRDGQGRAAGCGVDNGSCAEGERERGEGGEHRDGCAGGETSD